MEILMTVLITLGVCAVMYTFVGVVRLNRKAEELDTLQMDVMDVEIKINQMIEKYTSEWMSRLIDLEADLRKSDEDLHKDCVDRIEGWVASTDRRFDKTWNEIHKLDETVNPNMDILKK